MQLQNMRPALGPRRASLATIEGACRAKRGLNGRDRRRRPRCRRSRLADIPGRRLHACAPGLLRLANHGLEGRAVDQPQIDASGKGDGRRGESARGHDIAAGGAMRRHHAVELAHDRYADLQGLPLLALNEVPPRSPTANPCSRNASPTRSSKSCHVIPSSTPAALLEATRATSCDRLYRPGAETSAAARQTMGATN